MRTTRIEIEGRPGRYATMSRKVGSRDIEVTVLTPERPKGKTTLLTAGSDEASEKVRRKFAARLHLQLEGYDGTNCDVECYQRELERFVD